ncbi:MAG: DUF1801 domain-containing protein [Planctomycetota bacterium]
MTAKPTTVDAYLAALPDDRREAVSAIRDAINARLPDGYAEGIQYNMIGWYVPHELYPHGYHCDPKQPLPFAHLASQKNHIGIYLFCSYMEPALRDWFVKALTKDGHKLDMGASCIRVKALDEVPLKVVGQCVAKMPLKKFIKIYEANLPASVKKKRK